MTQTKVIQVTNVAPAATKEQMQTLFSFLGKIDEIKLYPEDISVPVTSKVCYVKYDDPTNCGVAQHLTNTVFIDRALIVVPCQDGIIPDEAKALQLAAPANAVAGMIPGGAAPAASALLPTPAPIANPLLAAAGVAGGPGVAAGAGLAPQYDPALAALGLPQPPPLPGNVDPSKIEEIRRTIYVGNLDSATLPPLPGNVDPSKIDEIRRTVYVGNLDSATVTAEQLLNFFQQVGEVKYVRMAGDETQPTRFAFVEFADQTSVAKALQYNGIMFGNRPLKINHSNNAIVKPQTQTPEAQRREIEEAMKRVRDAEALITAAIEPGAPKPLSSYCILHFSLILCLCDMVLQTLVSRARYHEPQDAHPQQLHGLRVKKSQPYGLQRFQKRRTTSGAEAGPDRDPTLGDGARGPGHPEDPGPDVHAAVADIDGPGHGPRRDALGPLAEGGLVPANEGHAPDPGVDDAPAPVPHLVATAPPVDYPAARAGPQDDVRALPNGRHPNPRQDGHLPPNLSLVFSWKITCRIFSRHKKEKKKDKDKDRDRSGSRERDTTKSKKKKKDKDKDKDREREKDKEKHRGKSKEQEEEKKEAKVTRDYDEEEQGYDSEKEKVAKAPAPEAPVEQPAEAPPSSEEFGDSGSQGQADMDVDSD
uniref:Splicing regulatory glutamine/lysine-rich protein 1 n=1 Tax=Branchiostoma floridae TaxID=7739 RepID=C3YCF1_BRAFL|eukprot:XP_002605978.1 hypothetical protein BRAFLDRAFT_126567 [Branchiostoma floridae]